MLKNVFPNIKLDVKIDEIGLMPPLPKINQYTVINGQYAGN